MTINYQFGDVDAHGAMIRALAGLLEAEHQAIISDVLTASDFWGGAGSAACQGFITQLGRNFQVIYELALMRRHQRLDHGPELVRNHTHSRHRPILAGQYLKIWETRPSTAAVDRDC